MDRHTGLTFALGLSLAACTTPTELSPSVLDAGPTVAPPSPERRHAEDLTHGERAPIETVSHTDPFPLPPALHIGDRAHQGGAYVEHLATLGDEAFADDPTRALGYWRWASVGRVARLQGLDFSFPVGAQILPRSQLAGRVRTEIAKEYGPARLAADALALFRFGFVESLPALGKTYADMLTEEIAGFYDPDTKELYLIGDAPKKAPGLLDFLTGSDGTDEQKLVLDHEICHALQDQRYDLFAMQAAVSPDDDAAFALTALIEGDATVLMMLAMLGESERQDFMAAPAALFDATMALVLPLATVFASGDAFNAAPRLIREQLLAPYTRGFGFAFRLWQAREQQSGAVQAAFRDPPRSSEQILHPERYLGETRDGPRRLVLGKVPPALVGKRLVKENCLGEFALTILFEDHLGPEIARAAAGGWDGDTYRVYDLGDARSTVVWTTIWDSVEDAQVFESAVASLYQKAGSIRREVRARRAGERVAVVIDPTDAADAVLDWLLDAKAEPKTFRASGRRPSRPFPTEPDPAIQAFMRRVHDRKR